MESNLATLATQLTMLRRQVVVLFIVIVLLLGWTLFHRPGELVLESSDGRTVIGPAHIELSVAGQGDDMRTELVPDGLSLTRRDKDVDVARERSAWASSSMGWRTSTTRDGHFVDTTHP